MLFWPAGNSSDLYSEHEPTNEDVSHCIPSSFRSSSLRAGARATVRPPVENLVGTQVEAIFIHVLVSFGSSFEYPVIVGIRTLVQAGVICDCCYCCYCYCCDILAMSGLGCRCSICLGPGSTCWPGHAINCCCISATAPLFSCTTCWVGCCCWLS